MDALFKRITHHWLIRILSLTVVLGPLGVLFALFKCWHNICTPSAPLYASLIASLIVLNYSYLCYICQENQHVSTDCSSPSAVAAAHDIALPPSNIRNGFSIIFHGAILTFTLKEMTHLPNN